MSNLEETGIIGEISDQSTNTSAEEEVDEAITNMSKSPPSKGQLDRETGKLRSKYKILREALLEERLAEVDEAIAEVEEGGDGLGSRLGDSAEEVERRRRERLQVAHERKRVKVEAVVNDYQAKVQSINDEQRVLPQAPSADIDLFVY